MRKYLAIGHFTDSKNITSVAMKNNTMKDFRDDLGGNGFVPYVILTEKKMTEIEKYIDDIDFDLFKEVQKLTTNYRKWNDITEYIGQCFDIMQERMSAAN